MPARKGSSHIRTALEERVDPYYLRKSNRGSTCDAERLADDIRSYLLARTDRTLNSLITYIDRIGLDCSLVERLLKLTRRDAKGDDLSEQYIDLFIVYCHLPPPLYTALSERYCLPTFFKTREKHSHASSCHS